MYFAGQSVCLGVEPLLGFVCVVSTAIRDMVVKQCILKTSTLSGNHLILAALPLGRVT